MSRTPIASGLFALAVLAGVPLTGVVAATPAAAATDTINQNEWGRFLYICVRTPQQIAPFLKFREGPAIGSAINRNTEGMEKPVANAIPFDVLKDLHKDMVTNYLKAMQAVSLTSLSKNERLSILLNVHNAALVKQFIQLGAPRSGRVLDPAVSQNSAYLDAPVVTLDGQALSIRSLRQRIIAEAEDRNVIYGLWTGLIGGPEIQQGHFTARDVHGQLLAIRNDFVGKSLAYRSNNSGKYQLSELYDFYRPLFPTNADLLDHLKLNETTTFASNARFFDRKVAAFKMIRKDNSDGLNILGVTSGDQRGLSGQ